MCLYVCNLHTHSLSILTYRQMLDRVKSATHIAENVGTDFHQKGEKLRRSRKYKL